MYDDATGAGATLPRGAHRSEDDAWKRQVEVGVRCDDDRVVAAELQNRFAEPGTDDLTDAPAHTA